jgi:hypothetical protein
MAASGISGGLSTGVHSIAADVGGIQAPGALGGLSQPLSGALNGAADTLHVASNTLGQGPGTAGSPGSTPGSTVLVGAGALVGSVAVPVNALGTGGLSGLSPVTSAVATTVTNVGTGVSTVASSPAIAPVTTTLNTVVNNVASATGLSSTTGTGAGNSGAGADPVSSLLGRLKDLGKGNHGL